MSNPTLKQKKAFKIMTEKMLIPGEKMTYGQIMREAGYSQATSLIPEKLTKTKGWNQLLAEVSDEDILEKIRSIALDVTDKRACLAAADMLLKLKDRYPAGKLKVQAFNEEVERLKESDYIEQ